MGRVQKRKAQYKHGRAAKAGMPEKRGSLFPNRGMAISESGSVLGPKEIGMLGGKKCNSVSIRVNAKKLEPRACGAEVHSVKRRMTKNGNKIDIVRKECGGGGGGTDIVDFGTK